MRNGAIAVPVFSGDFLWIAQGTLRRMWCRKQNIEGSFGQARGALCIRIHSGSSTNTNGFLLLIILKITSRRLRGGFFTTVIAPRGLPHWCYGSGPSTEGRRRRL
jgi:hypothetical protein